MEVEQAIEEFVNEWGSWLMASYELDFKRVDLERLYEDIHMTISNIPYGDVIEGLDAITFKPFLCNLWVLVQVIKGDVSYDEKYLMTLSQFILEDFVRNIN